MKETIVCDRCKKTVEGHNYGNAYTAGYYDVTSPYWNKYAQAGEGKVCDSCMHKDPQYIADYGKCVYD